MPSPDVPSVAVLLVSHDGARWLPAVLAGLGAQTTRPGLVVGVDTGSRDESAILLEGGCHEVVRTGSAGYPEAVRLGLERIGLAEHDHEWVWLLHDDARPDDGALAALLAAATDNPRADLLGCKLREWPSLRRLLEVGVTVTGTARRETGLERGEYDQGQHDDVRRVLACNTAGLLVRRRVLEDLGGLDETLPVLGGDLDLGWRAAAAGHTTLVVPDAVVFHAEATRRGQRPTAVAGRHPLREERRATVHTLLANGSGALLPLRVLRLTVGAVLRALGLLLLRAPGEAADEVTGLAAVLAHPGRLRAARAARGRPGRPSGQVAHLLAPFWLPLRHGLDAAGDALASVGMIAGESAERRRLARLVTSPVSWATAAVVVLALVACRAAFGAVSGGGLSPAPDGRGAWWSLHLESWHALGTGTDVPAPPEVGPLALVGSVLGPGPTVSLLLLAAVPLALAGTWRLLRAVFDRVLPDPRVPSWVVALGAAAYGLVPLASGAWGDGRLGTTVAAALLPWTARAALGLVAAHAEARQRAGWRTGLLLTLVVSFAPVLWWLAVVLVVLVLVGGLLLARWLVRDRTVWRPAAIAVLLPVVLLLPWWVLALAHDAAAQLFLEAGRVPPPALGGLDLLAGRVGDSGAPPWAGLLLLATAVAALVPAATRRAVAGCWVVALLAAGTALVLSLPGLHLARTQAPAALGGLVVALQVALVTAAALGIAGLSRVPRLPRIAVVVAGLALAVVPVAGLAAALTGEDDLGPTTDRGLPVYLAESAAEAPQHGVLVVRGDVEDGFTWSIDRGDGVTLGEDQLLATAVTDPADAAVVEELLTSSTTSDGTRLRALGVRHVLLTDPADGRLAAVLDATPGLTPTGADPGARAWQVDGDDPAPGTVAGPGSPWRVGLLVVQGLVLLVVLVLAAPTIRRADPATEGRTR